MMKEDGSTLMGCIGTAIIFFMIGVVTLAALIDLGIVIPPRVNIPQQRKTTIYNFSPNGSPLYICTADDSSCQTVPPDHYVTYNP